MNPQSPLAGEIVDLFQIVMIFSIVIFALVTGLVLYSAVRYRAKGEGEPPAQVRGHKGLEIIWTLVPLLIVGYLFIQTARTMRASDPPAGNSEPDIIVIGHQYWWEVRHPKTGIVTANEFHMPAGRKVLFRLGTADVIHDFWVPQLGRKADMIPDRQHLLYLQANRPGTYQGFCSEYCGTQHAWMQIRAIAQSPEEFAAWEKKMLQPAAAPASAAARRGAELYQKLTCVNCHAIQGVATNVQAGPDLTHLASRETLGAGVVPNTLENLARWLRNPQAVKPGNTMPNMQLTDAQVYDLMAYLATLE